MDPVMWKDVKELLEFAIMVIFLLGLNYLWRDK